MRRIMLTSLMVCGAVLIGAQVQAQAPAAPAAPPAAGGTADGIPFDIPYGTPISLETAKKLVAAVEAEATKHRWKLNIAVVDTHGDLVHFSRMDGAQLASISISQGKARTAARYRRESRAFYNAFETGHPYVATLDPPLIASPGGLAAGRRRQADRRHRLQRWYGRSGRCRLQGWRRSGEIRLRP
jgi:glc operon protein GlcG